MKIYFDGGCRPNPGAIETAVVAGGKPYHRCDHGHGDNNDAEWLALIDALHVALDIGVTDVVLIGDSVTVVGQINGTARRIAPRFAAYLVRFRELEIGFDRVRIRHVRRAQNLAGTALERLNGRI